MVNTNSDKGSPKTDSAENKHKKSNEKRGLFYRFPLLGNLVLMILLTMLVIGGILILLDRYTRHGQSVTIPNVRGLSLEEAAAVLEKSDLRYELVDSVYTKGAVPGAIHDIVPEEGGFVKPGRLVFLTINAFSKPQSIIPELKDMSMRQARATLMGLGFTDISVFYKPGEYDNLTQAVTDLSGKELSPGTRIDITAPLRIVVSSNNITLIQQEGHSDFPPALGETDSLRQDSLPDKQPEKIEDDEAWW